MANDNPMYSPAEPNQANQPQAQNKKKKMVILASAIVLLIVLAVAVTTYFLTRPVNDTQAGGQVSVTADGFIPGTIEIKKGQTVTWTNTGAGSYYILGDTPEEEPTIGFDSGGKLEPGDTFTYTFEEAGTYTYHDRDNPVAAQGTVIVTE